MGNTRSRHIPDLTHAGLARCQGLESGGEIYLLALVEILKIADNKHLFG
jgi:hypothetical protein